MVGFIIGLVIGGIAGFFTAALCVAAHDNEWEKLNEEYEEVSINE